MMAAAFASRESPWASARVARVFVCWYQRPQCSAYRCADVERISACTGTALPPSSCMAMRRTVGRRHQPPARSASTGNRRASRRQSVQHRACTVDVHRTRICKRIEKPRRRWRFRPSHGRHHGASALVVALNAMYRGGRSSRSPHCARSVSRVGRGGAIGRSDVLHWPADRWARSRVVAGRAARSARAVGGDYVNVSSGGDAAVVLQGRGGACDRDVADRPGDKRDQEPGVDDLRAI